MQSIALRIAIVLLCGRTLFAASTYYIDPARGSADGDGSAAKPWKTLEEVASKGQLTQMKAGDTVLLSDGYHGTVTFSGDNEGMVTITAAKDQRPTLSRLTIPGGRNWTVRGLVISPSFGKESYKGNIVTFGESADSSEIIIEDCYIFSAEDASQWDAQQWMNANSGIFMGRRGKNLTLRNNYIRNTRFGINLCAPDSLCEGNIISDFSADGIRATRDGQMVRHNLIKNVYVNTADGDDNHDDGIQCFLFNKGKGTVKGVSTIGNLIIAHENPDQKWPSALQGIGYFDGPLVDFVVTDNVVDVDAWHGIALYDAQNATVERNVVWTPEGPKMRAWIMFGTKIKDARDNTAKDNYACTFNLKQPGTVDERNQPSTADIYKQAREKLYKTLTGKFGARHFAADRDRMGVK